MFHAALRKPDEFFMSARRCGLIQARRALECAGAAQNPV